MKRTLLERIMNRVEINPITGCWESTYSCNASGYAQIQVNGKKMNIHRTIFEALGQKIPKGSCVLHKCDNRKCCNIRHLFFGTQADNIADMVSKGRQAQPNGEKHYMAKLTEKNVIKIRKLLAAKELTQDEIGELYGVAAKVISDIKTGKSWSHLSD